MHQEGNAIAKCPRGLVMAFSTCGHKMIRQKMPIPVDFIIICQFLEYGVGYLKTTIPFKEQPRSIKMAFFMLKQCFIIFHSYFADHIDLQKNISGEL